MPIRELNGDDVARVCGGTLQLINVTLGPLLPIHWFKPTPEPWDPQIPVKPQPVPWRG